MCIWCEKQPITSTTLEKQTQTEFSMSSSLASLFQVVLGSESPTWIVLTFPFHFYVEVTPIMASITIAPNLF